MARIATFAARPYRGANGDRFEQTPRNGRVSRTSGTIGRLHDGANDPIEGYKVITIDGAHVGTVTRSTDAGLVVRCRSWLRPSTRTLTHEQAVIRDVDRTVLILASPEALEQATGASETGRGSTRRLPDRPQTKSE